VRLSPATILDLGAGTGYAIDALSRRYRTARVIALDFAHAMLLQARRRGGWLRRPGCVCADVEQIPLAEASVDLVFSNATLQWCNDLPAVFRECLRILRPGGLLMFTTFGPDTLQELREAWSQVDAHSHVSPFLDMHEVGDYLTAARFADTVIDAERLTLTYTQVGDLMRDLQTLGAHNATSGRARALTGRSRLRALEQAYEIHRSDGRLPASYEVLYGHAWAPLQRADASAAITVPLSAIGGRKPRA
jgi:malonyl-CoA O-methyltransferase